jgi:hypothetical protein
MVRRGKLIRFYTGDEPVPTMYAGFNRLDSALYRRYGGGTDTTKGTRAWHGRNDKHMGNVLSSSDNEITVETYPAGLIRDYDPQNFGLPSHIYAKPALREHNGGRFGNLDQPRLPELVLDTNVIENSRDSIELYTKFVQRVTFGTNMDVVISPWRPIGEKTTLLANAAWASRRTGRRMIHWPNAFGSFKIWWNADSGRVDTTFWSLPEPAEIRASINIGLCYGARGIHYPIVGMNRLVHGSPTLNSTSSPFQIETDWGFHGPTTDAQNDTATLYIRHWDHPTTQTFTVTVPLLYTGWRTNSNEVRWLNKEWLPKIGA